MSYPQIDFAKLTLQDALDYAILIEEEARERYAEFSDLVGKRYEGDAATFFDAMVVNEEKHRENLASRRQLLFGNAPARISADAIVDVEAPATSEARNYMSTRQALEVALTAEAKAYAFYNEALAYVVDSDVQALFLELRAEELEHQRLVAALLTRMPADGSADRAADEVDTPNL